MTLDNLKWLARVKEKYLSPGMEVLDIGSLNVNGEARSVVMDYARKFVGIDMRPGPGVDEVMLGSQILKRFGPSSFDLVINMNTLEHDLEFQHTLYQSYQVLKPSGFMVVVTPTFGFPIHRHPKDYWRFGEDAYREYIFDPLFYNLLELEEQFTKVVDGKVVNPCICAIGKKKRV